MYDSQCEECGRLGFHPPRDGAESQATTHLSETAHDWAVSERELPGRTESRGRDGGPVLDVGSRGVSDR